MTTTPDHTRLVDLTQGIQAAQRIDMHTVEAVAAQTADDIYRTGYAHVILEPGDLTQYVYSIVTVKNPSRNGGCPYWVAHSFGEGYGWHGHEMPDAGYVEDHWFARSQSISDRHSAGVMATFLTATAIALN